MTKKVLGNDPFASNNADESANKPAPRASTKPAAKTSKRPSAKASKAPPKEPASARASKRPKKNEPEDDLIIAAVPKVPAEAKHLVESMESAPSLPSAEPETESAESAESGDSPAPTNSSEPEISAPVVTKEPRDEEESAAIDEAGAEAAVATDASARDEEAPAASQAPEQEPQGSVEERIRDLESQLDVLLAAAGRERQREEAPTPAATANDEVTQNSATIHVQSAESAESADGAEITQSENEPQDIAQSEYYSRQWGRVALRDRAEEVDEFGLDREFAQKAQPVIDALYARWWRVETSGVENVPDTGRVILCANHAGAVPYDGLMLAAALRKEHRAHRTLRWLADDFVFHFPFMGVALNRLGAVRACQENAERLLRSSNVVGVFPEGVKGVSKPFGDRYQLQRFGRGGHVKLALRTRTPIVPVAIVGSEETHPMLPTGPIAKLLNMQFLPVTPTFPWLGALGLVPLPSKWSITFLEPIAVDGYDKDAADDELLVGRLNEKVRTAIQDELSRRVRTRQSAWR